MELDSLFQSSVSERYQEVLLAQGTLQYYIAKSTFFKHTKPVEAFIYS